MENKSVLEASLFQRHIEVERALALASKHEIVISKSVKVMIISYYDFRKCKSVEFIYILWCIWFLATQVPITQETTTDTMVVQIKLNLMSENDIETKNPLEKGRH